MQQRQLQTQSQASTTVPASTQQGLALVADSASPKSDNAPAEALVAPVMELLVMLVTAVSKKMKGSVLLRPVKLARALMDAVQQQHGAIAEEHVIVLMDPKSAVGKLR